jgi:hypothetical protein
MHRGGQIPDVDDVGHGFHRADRQELGERYKISRGKGPERDGGVQESTQGPSALVAPVPSFTRRSGEARSRGARRGASKEAGG